MQPEDSASGPDIVTIVRELAGAGIRYVLAGSVAAAAYGVAVQPRDLDIVPDLKSENLTRLAALLRRWGAKPMPDPDWPESLTPEECDRWAPDPPTWENLDHLMRTPHGLLDIVPTRARPYQDLILRAITIVFEGGSIRIAHPRDLIFPLRMYKAKHQARLPQLNAICERLEGGENITPRLPCR